MIMEKFKSFINFVIYPACLVFTVLCFIFSIIMNLSETELQIPIIDLPNLVQIFLFSLMFSLSGLLFRMKKWKIGLKTVLHFACFLTNISIVFFLVGKHYSSAKGAFVILLIFGLIYIIVAAVVLTARYLLRKDENENKKYKRQF